jgi:hypothetical protein
MKFLSASNPIVVGSPCKIKPVATVSVIKVALINAGYSIATGR